jgi:sugar/nucleoside kinase (ribokinase family)
MDAALFGLIVADVIAEPMDLRNPPQAGGLQFIRSLSLTSGGNVCNAGIAMAKLGMKVAAAGLVGDDVLGRAMLERLRHFGMDVAHVSISNGAQTCATVVAVETGGERCFFHAPGVTQLLDAAAFRGCFDLFRRCAWVQIGYFGLLPALTPALPELLRELRQIAPGTKIALDTVNPPAEMRQLAPILPHIDLFAPSRTEAATLTGEKDPQSMAGVFREQLSDSAIIGIKLDSEGCYLDDGRAHVLVPAYPVNVVDTTGAGDTWFGGLLTSLRRDMPLEQCGRLANRVAADCCTALGASAGVRTLAETLADL